MGTTSDSLPDSMAKLTTDYKAIITVMQSKLLFVCSLRMYYKG